MESIWAAVIDGAFAVGLALVSWWSTRQDAADRRLHERIDELSRQLHARNDALKKELEMLATEAATMKERMAHFPTSADHAELRQLIHVTNIQMSEMAGGQKILTTLLQQIIQDGPQRSGAPRRRRAGDN